MTKKMDFLLLFSFSLVCMSFTQCKQSDPKSAQIDLRNKEIMAIHDDVMPKMKDIYRLKKALNSLNDSDTIKALVNELEAADEAMMEWMHQYKKPSVSDSDYESYFASQKKSISDVRLLMLESLTHAEDFLSNVND